MRLGLGNTLVNGGALNPDGLSLDLQFATDRKLTARKGPTPTFTRASSATYYGPLIDVADYGVSAIPPTTGISNGRASWFKSESGVDITVFYTGTQWKVSAQYPEDLYESFAAVGSEFRPDQANWSGSGISGVTTSSTFGLVTAAINEPRFDHSTTAPNACKGLLIESSVTNLVFPSATLTTQTRTVTAIAHTLSFYGTGTVVLSGTHVATVTGTGAFPTRTTLTFTPTAGSLILTVTGTVQFAQLEAAAFVSSYIPTTSASAPRSAEVCSITEAAFTGFYNQSEGTIVGSGLTNRPNNDAGAEIFRSSDGTNNNRIQIGMTNVAAQAVRPFITASGTTTYSSTQGTASVGVERKIGIAYKTDDTISAFNGTLGTLDTTVTPPTNTNQAILFSGLGSGTISSLRYFKKRLANSKLQSLTV